MTVLQGFILGIVQGLAEFLPISSSGHLVLLQKLFGLNEGVLTFDIAVHIATLIAVIAVFRRDVVGILKKPFSKLPLLIIVATIPAILIGFLFREIFEGAYTSGSSLGVGFIFTGVVLIYAESVRKRGKDVSSTGYTDAAVVGIAQAIAIFPAVSRSGLTITGGLIRGLSREFALKFSLLMSIPTILGAAVLDIYKIIKGDNIAGLSADFWPIVVGMAAAAVSGYIAIRFMVKVLLKGSLKVFSYYVFILGALVLIDQIFFGVFFNKIF